MPAALPGLMLCALTGAVLAVNTPMPYTAWVGLGGMVLAAACLRLGAIAGGMMRRALPVELRFLLGFIVLAYVLALPVHTLGVSILLPTGLFLLLALLPFPRWQHAPAEAEDNATQLLILLVAAGFAALWSLESTRRFADFAETGVFRLWLDFFSHAGTIAEFGEPRALGRGSSLLADVPSGLYHFVSFALPALAVRLTGMAPLQSVTAVWLPAGIFATALGTLVLGRAIAGQAGGVVALLLLVAVPDTASYGLKQGLLSFHWMLETAPGSLYALPCVCAACCLLVPWCREANWRALLGSALMLGALILVRMNVFAWLVVPWVVTAVAGWRLPSLRLKMAMLAGCAVAPAAAMLVMARTAISTIGVTSYVALYMELLHTTQMPTAYDGLYPWLIQLCGRRGAILLGLVLAYIGMGGIPLLTFLGGAVLAWRRRRLEALDILPFAVLVWAGMLMLLAPMPYNGDYTEFRQRGFVLVVVVLLCWNARWLVLLTPKWIEARRMALIACVALFIPGFFVAAWKAPRMYWAEPFVTSEVPRDLIAAASWLRAEAGPASAFTLARVDEKQVLKDDATVLMGLSGVPAWLARAGTQRLTGNAVVRQRLFILANIAAAPDSATAFAQLRENGIDFYVVIGTDGPTWDPDRSVAAFRRGTVAIYRTGLVGPWTG
ncbi:MAG: hypothetical protein P4N59_14540 [Negativicutes bacterium]|nr:hypothetical protein [Negativicutes bacterium]